MSESNEHQSQLLRWIESATGDLTRRASKRLSEEFQDHYEDAVANAKESGATEDEAHAQAMEMLGDSLSTHLAAIPVHGDPYRLKVKAGLAVVGVLLVAFSLNYRSQLLQRAYGPLYDEFDLNRAVSSAALLTIEEILESGVMPRGGLLNYATNGRHDPETCLKLVQLLLSHGADPNFGLSEGGYSILYSLVNLKRNHPEFGPVRKTIFELLVDHGVDIEYFVLAQDWSIMDYASFYEDTFLVNRLRELGAYESPEALVYQKRYTEVIEWAEKEPSLVKQEFSYGATLLHLLASGGDPESFSRVLELGADLQSVDDFGYTVLHYAYWTPHGPPSNQNLVMQEYLLELGLDPNQADVVGCTPLFFAVAYMGIDDINLLLEHGGDPNMTGRNSQTPLHVSLSPRYPQPRSDEVALTLIEAGADIHAKDEFGNTPLHFAVATNMHRVIRELVGRGASLEARNSEYTGRRNSMYVNIGEGDSYTPLHVATIAWSDEPIEETLETISLLLELGADINARAGHGRTPIWNAVNSPNIDVVRVLLEQGADPTIPDEDGITALHTRNSDKKALFAEFGYETYFNSELACQ